MTVATPRSATAGRLDIPGEAIGWVVCTPDGRRAFQTLKVNEPDRNGLVVVIQGTQIVARLYVPDLDSRRWGLSW